MIRPRGGTARRDGDGQDGPLDTPPDSVGARLRRAREERGFDLLAVHDRLGRPITHLEALETGNVATLPDETLAASTLRRYATFLGLDGDALADEYLAERSAGVSVGAAARPTAAVTTVVAAVTTGPDHLRAFTETGEVPQVAGRISAASGTSGTYDYAVAAGPPTGTFPVVPQADLRKSKRSVAKVRRRMRAPTSLKVVTWIVAGMVALTGVAFVLLAASPVTLANAHILRVVAAGSGTASGGTQPSTTTADTSTPHQVFPVVPSGSTPSSASYTVATGKFSIVVATSGPCWVQVTSSSSPVPLISGVQPAAKVLTYPADGTMTVEIGSSAVLVGVTIKGKHALTDAPKVAPFTYTFTPVS